MRLSWRLSLAKPLREYKFSLRLFSHLAGKSVLGKPPREKKTSLSLDVDQTALTPLPCIFGPVQGKLILASFQAGRFLKKFGFWSKLEMKIVPQKLPQVLDSGWSPPLPLRWSKSEVKQGFNPPAGASHCLSGRGGRVGVPPKTDCKYF